MQGMHFPEALPIHPRLSAAFRCKWPIIKETILNTPGGFEGDCASLLHWHFEVAHRDRPACLRIATGYRPYSQGHTLKTVLLDSMHEAAPNALLSYNPAASVQPVPGLSWGSSLTTLVLLPGNRALTGLRSKNMQTNPELWACLFTEALEPRDVSGVSMAPLLDRLVLEELGTLGALGQHHFVGLAFLPESYSWTLVSVLDLRKANTLALAAALDRLVPDNETQQWGQYPLDTPELFNASNPPELLGLSLAQDIVSRLNR